MSQRRTKKLTAQKAVESANNVAESSQYSDKPITPQEDVIVVNELNIQQVHREPLKIDKWRAAHSSAESRFWPDRSWLYDIYDDVMIDGHLTGIYQKRLNTVLNKVLRFKRDDKDVTELNKLIGSVAFRNVCKEILETQMWGISGIEFTPGKVFTPKMIPRKHINTKHQVITIEQNGQLGVDYTKAKNMLIVGDAEDLGILLKCAAYVIYKRKGLADWAQYLEIFGQPVRVMKYDTNDRQAKIELKKVLTESGSSLALMIPKNVDFELKDGKQSNGDGQLQERFTKYCDNQLDIIVLGNTETTGHDGKTGTGAKSEIHKEQQDEIIKSDMFYLLSWLNSDQFLQILESYGYDVKGGAFISTQEISIKYLAERIKIDMALVEAGLPIDDDYFYGTYGIPKPKNYVELKKALQDMNKAIMKQLQDEGDPAEEDDDDEEDDAPPKPAKKKKKPAAIRYRPASKLRNLANAIGAFFPLARW